MKLPIIKHLAEYVESHGNDVTALNQTVEVLEHLSQARGLKTEELDTIGELISNICGAVEVAQQMNEGTPKTEALNAFMKRVVGSIDKSMN